MFQRSHNVIDGRFLPPEYKTMPTKMQKYAHRALDESVCLRYIVGKN
ncbi:MAG: hypothetical protein HN366_00020 [Deltaproteobacteria bacterium]|jgi:hypothetical protein|nr:hypothetical protein [Deltaproteobacteria bacterium]